MPKHENRKALAVPIQIALHRSYLLNAVRKKLDETIHARGTAGGSTRSVAVNRTGSLKN